MNVFFHDFKSYRRSTIIWSASLALLAILFLSLFPAFTKDVDASQQILSNLPQAIRDALGISLANFFTVFGFFSYLFTFVSLAGAIQAMNLGVGIISKENTVGTADFLLTKPVSRTSIVTEKILAAVSSLIITNVIFLVAAFTTAKTVTTDSFNNIPFLLIAGSLLLIQLAFLALGLLLSVIIPKIKSTIAVSLPTIFTFFIVGSIGSVVGNDTVRYLTPFKFYDPAYIVQHGQYELKFLVLELGLVATAIALTYVLFNRKDIRSAN